MTVLVAAVRIPRAFTVRWYYQRVWSVNRLSHDRDWNSLHWPLPWQYIENLKPLIFLESIRGSWFCPPGAKEFGRDIFFRGVNGHHWLWLYPLTTWRQTPPGVWQVTQPDSINQELITFKFLCKCRRRGRITAGRAACRQKEIIAVLDI